MKHQPCIACQCDISHSTVETLFSHAGFMHAKARKNLKPKTVQDIAFAKMNTALKDQTE